MQEIIKTAQQLQVSAEKFYGVSSLDGKEFITMSPLGLYNSTSFKEINKIHTGGTESLKDFISGALNIGDNVFEFDTNTDLLKWSLGLENKGKKVENHKNAILLENITEHSEGSYFGVLGSLKHEKFFIAQEGYHKGKFKAVCENGLTYSNHMLDSESDTLKGCIENVLDRNAKVFKFDSCKELFAWLSQ